MNNALAVTRDDIERESLLTLQSEMQQLIQLTKESLDAKQNDLNITNLQNNESSQTSQLDEEYALFMVNITYSLY